MLAPFCAFTIGLIRGWRLSARRYPSRAAFESAQAVKLDEHWRWIAAHSPYYQRLLATHTPQTAPLMNKGVMNQHFDEINTARLSRATCLALAEKALATRQFTTRLGPYSIGLSSGTSGTHGIFVSDNYEQGLWAGSVLQRLLPRPLFQRTRIALLLRANNPLYESLNFGPISFRYFDLTGSRASLASALQSYGPTILVSPPTVLCELARSPLSIRPTRIFSVAEVLDPDIARQIELTYGSPPHQIYQATEGFLASSCHLGRLHLNEDLVKIDRLPQDAADPSGRFQPVLTDLLRYTQPALRYQLGDILTPGTPCACGSIFQTITRIEGRSDDLWRFGDQVIYPDFINLALGGIPALLDWEAVLHPNQQIYLYLDTPDISLVADRVHHQLHTLFARYKLSPAIHLRQGLPARTTDKRRRVRIAPNLP